MLSPAEVSQAEAKISALHGKLAPVDGQPIRFCVPLAMAATTAERRALSAVAERVRAELAPIPRRDHVDAMVSRVLLGFEQGRGRGAEEEVLISEYISALKDLPLAGIHGAAERFRSGTTLLPWSRWWRPSPAEFAAEAREGLIPLRAKLVHIRQILDAEVYVQPTDEYRAKVQAAAAAWLNRGGDTEHGHIRPTPEALAAAREDALHEHGAQFREVAGGGSLAQLAARLDAKAAAHKERAA
ncbi:hypothetical protein [Methylorubrum extorquens]|uniref:hypothetical protein n=1 Tax=Methylorubrum extorquens TaxID=408 RepID=UPI00209F63ED|nr:hypothetical protein [Methylorubrum extorquens]MCP1538996.1 hypothetical protein [Methylorubrum extorquens]